MLTKSKINALKTERMEKVTTELEKMRKIRRDRAKKTWNSTPLSWERLSFEMDKMLEDDAVIVSELDARDAYYWMDFAQGKKDSHWANHGICPWLGRRSFTGG